MTEFVAVARGAGPAYRRKRARHDKVPAESDEIAGQNTVALMFGGVHTDPHLENQVGALLLQTTYLGEPAQIGVATVTTPPLLFFHRAQTAVNTSPRILFASAAALTGNLALICGGQVAALDGGEVILDETREFDYRNMAYTSQGKMSEPRSQHAVAHVGAGIAIAFGGLDREYNTLDTCDLYYSSASGAGVGLWDTVPYHMYTPRAGHTATVYQDPASPGHLLVFLCGGYINSDDDAELEFLHQCETFDPLTAQFRPRQNMHMPRVYHTATLVPGNNILVIGGKAAPRALAESCELYSPAQNTWVIFPPIPNPRYGHATAVLYDYNIDAPVIIVSGGQRLDRSPVPHISYLRLYPPNTRSLAWESQTHSRNDSPTAAFAALVPFKV